MTVMADSEKERRIQALAMENNYLLFPEIRELLDRCDRIKGWKLLLPPWNIWRGLRWLRRCDELLDQARANNDEMDRLVDELASRSTSFREM